MIRLRKPHQDKWGGIFEAGDEVIHGNYFQTTDQTLLNQRNYSFDRFATSANFKIRIVAIVIHVILVIYFKK